MIRSELKYSYPDNLIIIFAREPVSGLVKTRLIPTLGKEGATKLYCRLLDYTVKHVTESELSPVNLCITPESQPSYFTQMACAEQFEISVQMGNDLGVRMYNALLEGLKQYSKVILIGTDCPFLTATDLRQAINVLDEHDMVFSPTRDGGYVLVGAKKVLPGIFKNIDWGTEKVMEQTRYALIANQLDWKELSEQDDIDVKDDLKYLLLHNDFKEFI
ncbi:MAG: TIGR04282 family arsenosugar biosynthesis glycosyltransferase [Gammaproteobacteria bacterium]|nr:TIGR04282 family arsenosugar biosynthesis glycosyltransferase [Gammaproteobacteria bacterium]